MATIFFAIRAAPGNAYGTGLGVRRRPQHGYAERLLGHIDDYKRLNRELTGMELCINKCTLLVSGGARTQ